MFEHEIFCQKSKTESKICRMMQERLLKRIHLSDLIGSQTRHVDY